MTFVSTLDTTTIHKNAKIRININLVLLNTKNINISEPSKTLYRKGKREKIEQILAQSLSLGA